LNRARLVARNVVRKRVRTAFTVASIAATLLGLTLLLAVVNTIESPARQSLVPRVVTRSATSLAVLLNESQGPVIRRLPGVAEVVPYTWFGGVWKDPKYFFAQFAIDPETWLKVFPDWSVPPGQYAAFRSDRAGALIGAQLAAQYGLKVGDRMQLAGKIFPVQLDLTVRGIARPVQTGEPSRSLFFQRDYLEELLGRPGYVGSFFVRVNSPADIAPVMQAIDREFYNSDHETKSETEKSFGLMFVSMLGSIRTLALLVGLIAVGSILLVVGNTMAIAVRERTGEIAVLKTIGFTPFQVLAMIMTESLALASLGGLLGIGGAAALTPAIRAAAQYAPFLQDYQMAPAVLGVGAAVTLLIGLASGGIPAWTSSRMNVVEGLRKVV
jgi:putative ABC transport system permease protein